MGFLGALFGGGSGAGFNAQQSANLQNPYNSQQVLDQLQQYQQFVNALQQQGGVQNQSNVFNQLQGVANGQGPNPAQAMLNQATGANVANQAALMAGQRGSSANPGLLARQAAMQGGALQQQAAGQGATMQANQSLNALGQLGGLASQQVAQQANAQGNLLGQTQAGLQNQNANQVNLAGIQGQVAQQNAKGQGGILNGIGGALGSIIGLAEGGAVPSNQEANIKEDDSPSIVDHILGHCEGGMMSHSKMKRGGKVPGKAAVKGDSYKNDKVPAVLSPGEIVVPRSKAKDPEKAAKFAHAVAMRSNKR